MSSVLINILTGHLVNQWATVFSADTDKDQVDVRSQEGRGTSVNVRCIVYRPSACLCATWHLLCCPERPKLVGMFLYFLQLF